MINGLGVVGWGVGGIEAEACMLGQPVSMLLPPVVGFKLHGKLRGGRHGHRPRADRRRRCCARRASSASSSSSTGPASSRFRWPTARPSPTWRLEYGATIGVFPVDAQTLAYLRMTNRPKDLIALVEAYYQEQGMFLTARLARPRLHRHARTRSRPASSHPWPVPSARRTGCC